MKKLEVKKEEFKEEYEHFYKVVPFEKGELKFQTLAKILNEFGDLYEVHNKDQKRFGLTSKGLQDMQEDEEFYQEA